MQKERVSTETASSSSLPVASPFSSLLFSGVSTTLNVTGLVGSSDPFVQKKEKGEKKKTISVVAALLSTTHANLSAVV